MIIDWHTHVHSPREQAAPFWRGQCPATIDNVLRLHDEIRLDVSVISNSGHYLKEYSREEALPAIREANQYLASLRDSHKGRLVALAVAIPGGGGICATCWRWAYAYELRDDTMILGPYGPPLSISRKPSEYLRMLYFDTVSYHAPAVECAIKTVGVDHLIFGTDSPMLIALKK